MFEFFLWGVLAVCVIGVAIAYQRTQDCFHPLVILLPMTAVIYWYMPWSVESQGLLDAYLDMQQRVFVQTIYFMGVAALVVGCFAGGGLDRISLGHPVRLMSVLSEPRMRRIGYVIGGIGFASWCITIVSVGGLSVAFGRAYGGGWSDYGYLREAQLTLLPAMLLLMPSMMQKKTRSSALKVAIALFALPSLIQGLLGARRGPTFMIAATLGMAWYLYRDRRPSLLKMAAGAALLGYLVMFLVVNRSSIYIGSDFSKVTYNVGSILTTSSGGNEYIYGSGSLLSAETADHFYWGKRYLAEFLVRPIPRQLWPNKYADFGVPELEMNAGTGGAALQETMGWSGAVGSAPGIVADLWIEFRWLSIPAMAFIGWLCGRFWRNAIQKKGFWILQYIVTIALSLYLVMQTMEAVMFRFLILSIPIWCASYVVHHDARAAAARFVHWRVRAAS